MTMDETPDPQVISAEKHHGDLLITFSDGRAALYPARLLYAVIAQAEEVKRDQQ
jgi:hypothetical protein